MAANERKGPVAIVDPFSSGGLYAPVLRDAGIGAVAVSSRAEVLPTYLPSYHPEDFPEAMAFTGDVEPIARRLRKLDVRAVLPGAESGVELADRLAALVTPELANDPVLAGARRDKGEMAEAARRAGLPVIRQICTDDWRAVADWIHREGLGGKDLVVKPPRSASTDGVTRVRENWRDAFLAQLGGRNQWDGINERMVVQEYATGTEYVVDVFSHDGRHTVTDVCRYGKVDNAEYMAVYDWMEWQSPDAPAVAGLVDYTRRFLDAVGFRNGAAHVELMQTDNGPRLIELNARPHGGGQPRFCQVATGDSQIHRAVRHLAGAGPVPDHYTLRQATMVTFLISRATGVVSNVACLDDVRGLDTYCTHVVGVQDGDRLEVTKDLLNTLSLGFVVLSGPHRKHVWDDYAEVRRIESGLVIV